MLTWQDLTHEEQCQAEISYLSILEDVAADGDEYDIVDYEMKRDNRNLRREALQYKLFVRDPNGYIFVNM
jgi:hypothetical protein